MKKLALTILTALAFAAPSAHAQTRAIDPKTEAAVKDMLVAMNYRQTVIEMNQQMGEQLPQLILSSVTESINNAPNMTAEKREKALAEINAKLPEIVKAIREVMDDPKMIDELINAMPALYARHFTTAEIIELGKFYKTPVGAKTLKVLPQLTAESMQLGQQLVTPRVQEVLKRFAPAN